MKKAAKNFKLMKHFGIAARRVLENQFIGIINKHRKDPKMARLIKGAKYRCGEKVYEVRNFTTRSREMVRVKDIVTGGIVSFKTKNFKAKFVKVAE